MEVVALYDIPEVRLWAVEGEDPWQGSDIATDARHGWRKNSKETSVVANGDRSHRHEHVT